LYSALVGKAPHPPEGKAISTHEVEGVAPQEKGKRGVGGGVRRGARHIATIQEVRCTGKLLAGNVNPGQLMQALLLIPKGARQGHLPNSHPLQANWQVLCHRAIELQGPLCANAKAAAIQLLSNV